MAVTRIQIRRGTAAEWAAANPILAAGEEGITLDTKVFKIGDGITPWNALAPALNGTYVGLVAAPTGNTTTDRATLQAAITASGWPANPAHLVLSAGEYKVASGLTLDGGGASSTPALTIEGLGTTISTTTAAAVLFTVTNSIVSLTRVKFRGIIFKSNAAGAVGVALHNAELCEFISCGFIGSGSTGISIDGVSSYNRISSCEFTSLARGIYAEGVLGLQVENCSFGEQLSGTPLNWIELGTSSHPVSSCVISGNTFYSTGATLPIVRLTAGYGCTVIGNVFDQSDVEAIWVGTNGVSEYHTIIGNTFYRGKRHDIYIDGGRGNTVIGNIFGVRNSGVATNTYANVRITNHFGSTAGYDNTVSGNQSQDTAAAITNIVEADAACQNLTIIGNSGLAGISAPHASNLIFDSTTLLAKSKLAALAIVDADVDAAAAIAKSKLAALAIVNADVDAAAAIAQSKIANLTTDLAAKATADQLPWLITINPLMTPVAHVTWNTVTIDATLVMAASLDASNSASSSVSFDIVLAAGTWTFELIHGTGTSRGIYTFTLSTTGVIGTIDGYAASGVKNTKSSVTGVVIAATGKQRLTISLATKNASSSGNSGSFSLLHFKRTA